MKHPLSTPNVRSVLDGFVVESECPVSVVDVNGGVVCDITGEAVPEHFDLAVSEGWQGGLVNVASGSVGVVALSGPARALQDAQRPVLQGVSRVVVAGETVGDDKFVFAAWAGDGRFAGGALQTVRALDVCDVGDPSGYAGLVSGGAFVVADDRTQFGHGLAVGDKNPEPPQVVQGDHPREVGVVGIKFLPYRPTAVGHEIRVDRHWRVSSVDRPFHEYPVTSLEDHPPICRVGLGQRELGDQDVNRFRVLPHAGDAEHPLARATESHQMELLGPVDSHWKRMIFFVRRVATAKAPHRADRRVFMRRHRCWRQVLKITHRGRSLSSVLEGQAQQAFPRGGLNNAR